jgi:hypothetical protein
VVEFDLWSVVTEPLPRKRSYGAASAEFVYRAVVAGTYLPNRCHGNVFTELAVSWQKPVINSEVVFSFPSLLSLHREDLPGRGGYTEHLPQECGISLAGQLLNTWVVFSLGSVLRTRCWATCA